MTGWSTDTWFGFFGLLLGIAGLIYAVMTNQEKVKLENLVRAGLRGVAGNICKIEQSAGWSYEHLRQMQDSVLQLQDSEAKNEILRRTLLALGDASASTRMLVNVLNEVLAMQLGLFNTKEIHHPEEGIRSS